MNVYEIAAARAIDRNLLFSESPLEVSTMGTLAPIITAADVAPPRKFNDLYKMFAPLISGARIKSASPATLLVICFSLADFSDMAPSSARGPSIIHPLICFL